MSSELKPGIIGHWDWRRALYRDDDLRDWAGKVKHDPRQLAALLSDYGANGRECNISDARLGELLGWHRNTVGNHRRELIKRGWLVRTGHFSGRLERVSISLPADGLHNLDCAIQTHNGEDRPDNDQDSLHNLDCATGSADDDSRMHNGGDGLHNLDCALSDSTYTDSSNLIEVQEDSGTSLTANPTTKGGLDGSELPGIEKLEEPSMRNIFNRPNLDDLPPWERIDPIELTELINIADTAEDLEQLWRDYKNAWIETIHTPVASARHREIKAARRDHG